MKTYALALALVAAVPFAGGCAAPTEEAAGEEPLAVDEAELQGATLVRSGGWATVAQENPVGMMSTTEIARVSHGRGQLAIAFDAPVGPTAAPGMTGRAALRLAPALGGGIVRVRGLATCTALTTSDGYNQGKLGTTHRCQISQTVAGKLWTAGVTVDTLTNTTELFAHAPDLVKLGTASRAGGNVFESTSFESD